MGLPKTGTTIYCVSPKTTTHLKGLIFPPLRLKSKSPVLKRSFKKKVINEEVIKTDKSLHADGLKLS